MLYSNADVIIVVDINELGGTIAMKYRFSDIDNKQMYDNGRVILIAGQYPIFNNIVIDKVRNSCKGDMQNFDEEAIDKFISEFNGGGYEISNNTSLDFNEFMDVVKVPPVNGKWFCNIDYSFLTKKQKETLTRYYKKPSEHGVLVVTMEDWKDYKFFINNRAITGNNFTHLIQLSYPSRATLKELVIGFFKKRRVTVSEQGAELFIMRMSNAYNDYADTMDKVCIGKKEYEAISYADMIDSLKGVENYVLDDLLEQLMVPIKSKKVVLRRKIYKMLNAIVSDMGAKAIVNKIKYKLDDLIEMRIQINAGNIPVMVRYNIEKVKGRLDDENRLNKLSDYAFKRYAYLASQTSLKDWYFMKLILSNVKNSWSEVENERVLLSLVHRSTMSTDRLMNNIGIKNTLEENLMRLNCIFYDDSIRRIGSTIGVGDDRIDYTTGEILKDSDVDYTTGEIVEYENI